MKITHVTTRVLRTPADNRFVVGLPAPADTREFVTLELGTDQGLVGLGLTFFGGADNLFDEQPSEWAGFTGRHLYTALSWALDREDSR